MHSATHAAYANGPASTLVICVAIATSAIAGRAIFVTLFNICFGVANLKVGNDGK
jgi:hypothetical protein